jgi:hypothetical protein
MIVRHHVMHAMAELAELLYESGTLLEWPTAVEMVEMFPYMHPATSRQMLMFLFRSYYPSWCAPSSCASHKHLTQTLLNCISRRTPILEN